MKIIKLEGKIKLMTGLHIGGGDDTMHIGGIQNPVIKDINTNKPYIPGSSIKGKMRSLLEWSSGLVGHGNGSPASMKEAKSCGDNQEKAKNVVRIFGSSDPDDDTGITRIVVRDAFLSKNQKHTKFSEAKYENTIDRKSAIAKNPRQTERVPAGIEFDFSIKVKILDGDAKEAFQKIIEEGIKLIENDYLGGNGSRGYGRVEFDCNDWE